jgi:hypothetical protein
MIKLTIKKTQEVPQKDWPTFCDQFTQRNHGRLIALEMTDDELGDELLVKQLPLSSITCEPATEGNALISIGLDEVAYSHTVTAPKAVWIAKDEIGQAIALEIIDHNDNQTILRFSE